MEQRSKYNTTITRAGTFDICNMILASEVVCWAAAFRVLDWHPRATSAPSQSLSLHSLGINRRLPSSSLVERYRAQLGLQQIHVATN